MWQAAAEAEKRRGPLLPWQNPVKSWDVGSIDGAPFRQVFFKVRMVSCINAQNVCCPAPGYFSLKEHFTSPL